MKRTISAKELRSSFPKIVNSVRKGEQFTVLYRNEPVFRIVPIDSDRRRVCPLSRDPLYGAQALGKSSDGFSAADHDRILYGA